METGDILNYTYPVAGVGIVVMEVPAEGMVYVLPRLEDDLWFGGTNMTKGLIKIIEQGEGEDFGKIMASSEKMHVLGHGAKGFKDYFNYEPGDEVVFIRLRHVVHHAGDVDDEVEGGEYFVIGSWFDNRDEKRKPPEVGTGTRHFEFPDGSYFLYNKNQAVFFAKFGEDEYIKYDRESGELHVKVKGEIIMNGSEIWLN